MTNFWKDKVVFLTGASSGIGEALAFALADRGAVLGLIARRKAKLSELAKACETKGATAFVYAVDVTDAAALADAAESMRREFGHIDIMIANAGVSGADAATRNYDPAGVKSVIDINLLGAVNAVHAVLPAMIDRGQGQLVAISSLAGIRGLPKSAAYSASKAGMTTFFESVRLDTLDKGIDVTIIQPGFIFTPLTAGRTSNMPFLMKLDEAIPLFMKAIERKKKFASFPFQLASFVRIGKIFPTWLYDRIASKARYRE